MGFQWHFFDLTHLIHVKYDQEGTLQVIGVSEGFIEDN